MPVKSVPDTKQNSMNMKLQQELEGEQDTEDQEHTQNVENDIEPFSAPNQIIDEQN